MRLRHHPILQFIKPPVDIDIFTSQLDRLLEQERFDADNRRPGCSRQLRNERRDEKKQFYLKQQQFKQLVINIKNNIGDNILAT